MGVPLRILDLGLGLEGTFRVLRTDPETHGGHTPADAAIDPKAKTSTARNGRFIQGFLVGLTMAEPFALESESLCGRMKARGNLGTRALSSSRIDQIRRTPVQSAGVTTNKRNRPMS